MASGRSAADRVCPGLARMASMSSSCGSLDGLEARGCEARLPPLARIASMSSSCGLAVGLVLLIRGRGCPALARMASMLSR